jgi:hypothetical protein
MRPVVAQHQSSADLLLNTSRPYNRKIMGDHILSTIHHNASCRKTPLFLCMYSIGTLEFVSRESTGNGKKRNLQQEEA